MSNALVLVDSGHVDYADVNGADANLSLEEWVQRARDRRLVVPDRAALAEALEVDGRRPAHGRPAARHGRGGRPAGPAGDSRGPGCRALPPRPGPADRDLAGAPQEEQIPTLLLLATEPESAREQNERAGHAFQAVIHQADVRLVEGATHSLVTDLREEFGRTVAEWLATLR